MPSFEETLEGLELADEVLPHMKFPPSLYFGYRHGKPHGYKLALNVRKGWWERNKTSETDKTEVKEDYGTGSVYLILGTLPYGELGLDYEKRRQDRTFELNKLGWTIKDQHDLEMPSLDTIEVQNEYFSVSQQFCETD
jgi:hypothetical protein